jgi:hypothetical protein
MKIKLSSAWLILFLATRLSSQNSASHQIIINIIRPNSVSVSSLPAQSVTMDQSADAFSLLKWQTDGRPKKITLSARENQPLWVEMKSPNVKVGKRQRLSDVDQNLMSAGPRGSGQCLMKWLTKEGRQNNKPVKVALTVIEN